MKVYFKERNWKWDVEYIFRFLSEEQSIVLKAQIFEGEA